MSDIPLETAIREARACLLAGTPVAAIMVERLIQRCEETRATDIESRVASLETAVFAMVEKVERLGSLPRVAGAPVRAS